MTDQSQVSLPKGWVDAELAELFPSPKVDIVDGPFGSNLKATEYRTSGVPIIRLQNIDHYSFIEKNIKFISPEKAQELKRHSFAPDDIVITKLGAPLGKAAIVPNAFGSGIIVADVVRCRVDERHASRKYLMLAINSPYVAERLALDTKGTTRPRVNLKHIRSLRLPVAPRSEQDRIVEKVEMLFAQLDKGEEALRVVRKQLARYRQSILRAAVTGQLTAEWRSEHGEAEWPEVSLDSLTEYLTSGSRGWAAHYSSQGDIFIRAQNLKYDRLDLEDVAYVELPKNSEGTRTKVQPGDMLVTITGANVTKCALVRDDIGTAYVSQHVALLRTTDLIEGEFLFLFLVAKAAGRKQLEEFAYGAGKPGLNLQNIREVRIALPSRKEQLLIVGLVTEVTERIEAVEKLCETELARSAALRQSILKDAFAGRLVPQDPTDEPAADLLSRIKAYPPARPVRKGRKTVA